MIKREFLKQKDAIPEAGEESEDYSMPNIELSEDDIGMLDPSDYLLLDQEEGIVDNFGLTENETLGLELVKAKERERLAF